jgi:hypothetical protein
MQALQCTSSSPGDDERGSAFCFLVIGKAAVDSRSKVGIAREWLCHLLTTHKQLSFHWFRGLKAKRGHSMRDEEVYLTFKNCVIL